MPLCRKMPARRVLYSDTRAPTRSRASNAQDWFESFTLIGSSESSRENSGKIFDLFSPPGPSWSPNSAPKAVLCSSARRAASSYPWPSPRRRIERFALGASRYTQIASLSTGEEFRCLSASANGPCAGYVTSSALRLSRPPSHSTSSKGKEKNVVSPDTPI